MFFGFYDFIYLKEISDLDAKNKMFVYKLFNVCVCR